MADIDATAQAMHHMKPNDLVRPVTCVMRRETADTSNTATISKQAAKNQFSMAAWRLDSAARAARPLV